MITKKTDIEKLLIDKGYTDLSDAEIYIIYHLYNNIPFRTWNDNRVEPKYTVITENIKK